MEMKEISNIGPFNDIGSKIFGLESYDKIIQPLILANITSRLFPENSSRIYAREHNNLNINFISMLLNDELEISNLFWDIFPPTSPKFLEISKKSRK